MKDYDNTEFKEKFEKASQNGDIDEIQKLLLSEEGQDDEFHKSIWKDATEYCSKEETQRAYKVFKNKVSPHKFSWISVSAFIMSAAACIMLAINIWSGYNKSGVVDPIEIDWKETVAEACEMKEVILPDSTHVWLNADSKIMYPNTFAGKSRKVFIEGEAFLEVAKDSTHPFIVQYGDNNITVTGTKFNIKTFGENFTTTLIEGGIKVNFCGNEYIMSPGEHLVGNKVDGSVKISLISESKFPRWYKGEFNVYNETLTNIIQDLERKFGVEIILRNKSFAQDRFTFSFINGESLAEILDALSIVTDMTIEQKEDVIDIL